MTENEIATRILDVAFRVHSTVGPGLLESVYETCLEHDLLEMGLTVERQKPIPVVYRDVKMQDGFRADLVVGGRVIVEVKSQEVVPAVAPVILLTYLRFADMKLGLLINFHEQHLKSGIKRVANGVT
jgi:GxxExxY protein